MKINIGMIPGLLFLISSGIVAVTASCGGGGGGGGFTAAQISISADNADAVAAESTSSMGGVSTTGQGGVGIAAVRPRSGQVGGVAGLGKWVAESFLHAVGAGASGAAGRVSAMAMTNDTFACDSGDYSVTSYDNDNNNVISAGDAATLTFHACHDAYANDTTNGTVAVQFVTYDSAQLFNIPWQIDINVTFSNFSITVAAVSNTTVTGDARVVISGVGGDSMERLSIAGNRLAMNLDGAAYTMDSYSYVLDDDQYTLQYSEEYSGVLSSTNLGGAVTISTVTPFTGYNLGYSDPDAGVMVIRGAGNTGVRVTALSGGQVQLDIDTDGDGAFDDGTQIRTWAALEQIY